MSDKPDARTVRPGDGVDPPIDLPELATQTYKSAPGSLGGPQPAAAPPGVSPPGREDTPATYAPSRPDPGAVTPTGQPVPTGFRLIRPVATGGMGEIWEAVQESLGRVVAIKAIRADRLRQHGADIQQLRAEFEREALFAARLEHPNIIPVHDLRRDTKAGTPLLAMKYVQGTPWDRTLAADLPVLSPGALLGKHLPVLIQVAQAVAFAHARGVVHRDLKPAQVMLGEFGEVLLIDWGLAVFVGSEADSAPADPVAALPVLESRLTASSPSGTPALMAPEQTQPTAAGVGTWTDIYLLGGTLYYLLTGSYPHEDGSVHRAFMRARAGTVTPPSQRAPGRDIPADLERLCLWALQPSPGDRCPSTREFVVGLREHLSGDSQRRQSVALTDRVESQLAQGEKDYGSLSALTALLDQATALWIANPALAQLRNQVFSTHCRLALDNGDLVLARLQAERLDEGDDRSHLLAQVVRAERLARQRVRTRRLAIAAAFALLCVTIGGGLVFVRALTASREAEARQRASAENQRDLAADARSKSDDFARFVLNDMTSRLATLNRLDLLDPAMARAFEYYKSLPFDRVTPQERFDAASGLVAVASAARLRGNAALQVDALAVAAPLVEGEWSASPGAESPWSPLRLTLLSEQALLARRLGDVPLATSTIRNSVAMAEADLARAPGDTTNLARLSDALQLLAILRSEVGDPEGAFEAIDRMIALDGEAVRASAEKPLPHLVRLNSSLRLGLETLAKFPKLRDSLSFRRQMDEVISRFRTEFSDDASAWAAAGESRLAIAQWEYAQGSIEECLKQSLDARAHFERAAEIEPARPGHEKSIINATNIASVARQRIGDREEAIKEWRVALARLGRLRERDPANTHWTALEISILNNMISALDELKRPQEAEPLSQQLLSLARQQAELAPDVSESARTLALAHARLVGLLLSTGRNEEAEKVAREAVALADANAKRFPEDTQLAGERLVARTWLAGALNALLRVEQALEVSREAAEIGLALTQTDTGNRQLWENTASALTSTSRYQSRLGLLADSLESLSRAAECYRQLEKLDPGRVTTAGALVSTLQAKGEAAMNLGRPEEALDSAREALARATAGLEREPEAVRLRQALGQVALFIARVQADRAQESEAWKHFVLARDTANLLGAHPLYRQGTIRTEVDTLRDRMILTALRFGETAIAREILEPTIDSRRGIAQPAWSDRVLSTQIASRMGRTLVQEGRPQSAIAIFTSTTLELRQLLAERPKSLPAKSELTSMEQHLARAFADAGRMDEALAVLDRADSLVQELRTAAPDDPRHNVAFANALRARAEVLLDFGRAGEAVPLMEEALAVLTTDTVKTETAVTALLSARCVMARLLVRTGDVARARELTDLAAGTLPADGESEVARTTRDMRYWHAEAVVRMAEGDQARAAEAWKRIVDASAPREGFKESARDSGLKGVALFHLGRMEEARAVREQLSRTEVRVAEIFTLLPE